MERDFTNPAPRSLILVLMAVGSMGRQVDLLSCLPEQFLGFSSMAIHVELVGVLRRVHTADGLVNETLCVS